MSGAIHPFLQYSFMAWFSVKAQGQLYLYIYLKELSVSYTYKIKCVSLSYDDRTRNLNLLITILRCRHALKAVIIQDFRLLHSRRKITDGNEVYRGIKRKAIP
jgi:hypothetical protein